MGRVTKLTQGQVSPDASIRDLQHICRTVRDLSIHQMNDSRDWLYFVPDGPEAGKFTLHSA